MVVIAFLHARAITDLVGTELSLAPAQLAAHRPVSLGSTAQRGAERSVSARAILERNPFDHVTGALGGHDAGDTAAAGSPDASDAESAPKCEDVDVEVIVAGEDADWSFAAITGPDKKSHLLRRDGEIAGKKVYFIGRDRVWLSTGGSLCQAILFDAKKPPPAAPPPTPPPSSSVRSRAAPLDPDLRKGIQAVSATEFNIDRSVVDRILENQAELMRQARVIPVQENGRVVGVRLMGIRPDALLGVLGMQNGDRLDSINGFELASPEKALEAYARLRTADKISIHLNRGGKSLNLDYNIR